MKLPALLEEIAAAVEASDSSANTHRVLAQKALDLADMVGWADKAIDPHQRCYVRVEALLDSLHARFGRTGETSIATLHSALAELQQAIDRHDRDLTGRRDLGEYEDT